MKFNIPGHVEELFEQVDNALVIAGEQPNAVFEEQHETGHYNAVGEIGCSSLKRSNHSVAKLACITFNQDAPWIKMRSYFDMN